MTATAVFLANIRIVATVPISVAAFCTILRLYYRCSRRHFGMDDVWAGIALVAAVFLCAGAWLHSELYQSKAHRIMGYYMTSVGFTCVLWWARISILFSIVRIIPFLMVLRKWAYGCVAWFFAMWAVMIIQKTYICEHDARWKYLPGLQCVLGHSVAITELFTDVTADVILVFLPLRLLRGVGVGSARRKLLTAIFSASLITTIVSIVHSVYVFSPDRDGEAYMAHIEASTALIICNLAVLVTWLVRVMRHGEDLESAPVTDRSNERQGSSHLTTIRFDKDKDWDAPIVLTTMDDDMARHKSANLETETFCTGEMHDAPADSKITHPTLWRAQ